MKKTKDLAKLAQLAELVLDSRLTLLQAAARAKQDCEAQLSGLGQIPQSEPNLVGVSAELAGLQYQRWADARRAELNQMLARRTVTWMEARDEARVAFGKRQVLAQMAARQGSKN
jgi:hypothetical protein